jgi:hypothetical protein
MYYEYIPLFCYSILLFIMYWNTTNPAIRSLFPNCHEQGNNSYSCLEAK